MDKQRVMLVCSPSLLGESLATILGADEGVDLIGAWEPDTQDLAQLAEIKPDVVVVAREEGAVPTYGALTAQILARYPEIPVISVGLARTEVRVYTSTALPARSRDLLDAIHKLPHHRSEQPGPP
jgi:chemotaxis response regulator CheB